MIFVPGDEKTTHFDPGIETKFTDFDRFPPHSEVVAHFLSHSPRAGILSGPPKMALFASEKGVKIPDFLTLFDHFGHFCQKSPP